MYGLQQRRHRPFPKASSVNRVRVQYKRPPLPPMLHKRSGERVWVEMTSDPTFPSPGSINIPSRTHSQVACIAGTAWSSEEASIAPRRIRYSDPGRSRPITRSGSRGNDLRYGCHGAGEAHGVTMVLLAYYPIPFLRYADMSKFSTALVC